MDIDLISQDQWVRGIPHEQFTWLRQEAPVFWHESDDPAVPGFWALTRHADVQAANRDIEQFSSQRGGVFLNDQTDEQRDLFRSIIETDRPEHTRLRRLVNRGFTPRAIAQFEASYRQAVKDVLADVVARGTFDWVTEVATVLPAFAISELLGVPVEDRSQVTAWTNTISGANDPEFADGDADAPMTAAIALYTYGTQLAEQRRAEPRDDIVTSLITEVDDDALGAHEFEIFVLALAVAGNETTRTAMSQGMLALLANPDQMAGRIPGGPPPPLTRSSGGRRPSSTSVAPPPATSTGTGSRSTRMTPWRCISCRPTTTTRSSRILTASTSPGPPIRTCPSVVAVLTTASVPTWRGSRSRCCSRSSSPTPVRSSRPATPSGCARAGSMG